MAASIRAVGILEPLLVEPHPVTAGHYQVLAGHRRLAAAKLARLADIPVMIRKVTSGAVTATQLMLIENCHRADLTAVDTAVAMGKLRKLGMTAGQIAKATGLSASSVFNHLSLLDLDEATR